jgi:hypothetical protein
MAKEWCFYSFSNQHIVTSFEMLNYTGMDLVNMWEFEMLKLLRIVLLS